ncbi:hypothetical protein C0995_008410 [Termitomyces sp. Mi166|nr:hypothetical protein C0995_008410 [Termitomyces sp. Mi166\
MTPFTTTHPSSPSAPSADHQGTQTHSHTLRERRGLPSSYLGPPNHDGGQPKGHTHPTSGATVLPRRVRCASVRTRTIPNPLIELIRTTHPHLNISEFQNSAGAGFFVPAKRSRRRIPVRSRTLNERRGVCLFIRFGVSGFGGQIKPQGHLQPAVGNLPRRCKAVGVPQAQPARDASAITHRTGFTQRDLSSGHQAASVAKLYDPQVPRRVAAKVTTIVVLIKYTPSSRSRTHYPETLTGMGDHFRLLSLAP